MRDCDIQFIKQIKNSEDLCDYLSCECGVDFAEDDILCDDLKSLIVCSECNYDIWFVPRIFKNVLFTENLLRISEQ